MMIIRNTIFLFCIFNFSCTNKAKIEREDTLIEKINDDDIMSNAKWYFYSYAMDLQLYDKNELEVNPLDCSIKLFKISKVGNDTTKVFFTTFKNDTINECSFRPYDLIGITIVKEKMFLPIYHQIEFDIEEDSVVIARMNEKNLQLQNRVLNDSNRISNLWLKEQTKKRVVR